MSDACSAEITIVRHVIGLLGTLRALCFFYAPRAAVVLEAAIWKLREEYPEAIEKGPEA